MCVLCIQYKKERNTFCTVFPILTGANAAYNIPFSDDYIH